MTRVLLAAPADGATALYVQRAFEAEGCDVVPFDYRAGHSTVRSRELLHLVDRVRPDLVLILKGESISLEAFRALAERECVTALWHFDPRDGREQWVIDRARLVDVFFTIGRGLLPFYEEQGINAHWLLEAADPEIHSPIEGVNQVFPAGFVGTVAGVPERAMWLESIAKALPDDSLHLWGSFPQTPPRAVYHGRAEGDVGFRLATSQTLVVLGRDRNPEVEGSYGARLFRTLSVGAFYLTNRTGGIESDFGGALDVYADDEDCVRLIRYWLEDSEERARMAARGRALVIGKHTWRHRVWELMQIVGVV